jgi:hypothetical protein
MLLGLGASVLWLAASAESGERGSEALGPGRVVLVPVNLAVRAAPEVEPGVEPMWRALLEYFASEDKPALALDRSDAGALWNEVVVEARKAGEGDALYALYSRFARRIRDQVEFGNIVFPTLVTHSARVLGHIAKWDGVRRPVEVPGQVYESIDTYREGKIWVSRYGATGELGAASLHLAVLSPEGELRYEGRGGLVLLQELVQPRKRGRDAEFVASLRDDAFDAPNELREGIEAALRDWPSASTTIAQ